MGKKVFQKSLRVNEMMYMTVSSGEPRERSWIWVRKRSGPSKRDQDVRRNQTAWGAGDGGLIPEGLLRMKNHPCSGTAHPKLRLIFLPEARVSRSHRSVPSAGAGVSAR